MRKMIVTCLIALSLGAGIDVAAQSGAKEETKKAGEAAKEAGEDTADAAKHAGKATAKATKTGAKKVKKAVTGIEESRASSWPVSRFLRRSSRLM